jgi:23S rRNA pseudouridine1911/1915/1917 synthase
VREDGKYAFTKVRVASRYRSHTEITAKLLTGRTHQIRVHLASIGHPLIGDRKYGARGRLPNAPTKLLISQIQQFSRQALHAQRLSFVHPASAKNVRFEAPPPADYLQLKTALEEDASLHKA